MASPTPIPSTSKTYLFGGDKPWPPTTFTSSDDRIRGGSSQSHLTIPAPAPNPSTPSAQYTALFHGTLDTSTLGGAGFASQRTVGSLDWDLRGSSGVEIVVLLPAPRDGAVGAARERAVQASKKYVLLFKDSLPEKRPDGRDESGVSYEWVFSPADGVAVERGEEGCRKVSLTASWEDFHASYRGRAKGDAEPLDLEHICRMGVMMRSFFDEQSGPFELCIASIAATHLGSALTNPESLLRAPIASSTHSVDDNPDSPFADQDAAADETHDGDSVQAKHTVTTEKHVQFLVAPPKYSNGGGSLSKDGNRKGGWMSWLCCVGCFEVEGGESEMARRR